MFQTEYPNDYLTIKEAAQYTGCSVKTIRNLISSGKLPAKRRGLKIIVISLDDIHLVYSDLRWKRSYR